MLLQSDDAHVAKLFIGKIQFSLNANKFAKFIGSHSISETKPKLKPENKVWPKWRKIRNVGRSAKLQ